MMAPRGNQSRHLHGRHASTIDPVYGDEKIATIELPIERARLLDGVHHRHVARLVVDDDAQLARWRRDAQTLER